MRHVALNAEINRNQATFPLENLVPKLRLAPHRPSQRHLTAEAPPGAAARPLQSPRAALSKVRRQTWPGQARTHSAHSLQINYILTSSDWAAQVMSSKQGCQISLDERKRQKSQEMKYDFVAVRGTETKPCPGLSWSHCTKTGCESNDFVFQAMSP